MPESDLKADYEILLPVGTDYEVKPSVAKIKQAVAKYPNSARLQFRLGSYGKDDQALRRAAELDPSNALPLYYLASRAPSMDGSLALLRDANLRRSVTEYPLPLKGGARAESSAMSVNGNIALSNYLVPRALSRNIGKYASELHKQGRTDEALEALKQVRQMGWGIMRSENQTLLGFMIGMAVVRTSAKFEKEIYTEIGSKAGLAEIEREKVKLDYLQAGSRYYVTHANDTMVRGMARRMALVAPILDMGIATEFLLLLSAVWWSVLLLRSRKHSGSESHLEATKAFSTGRLAEWYGLAFLPAIAVLSVSAMLFPEAIALLNYAFAASMLLPVGILLKANAAYRTAYRQAAGMPSWRRASAADKREFQRRMLGVQGGAVIFLMILGFLISGGTKAATGSYPWDTQSYISQLRGEESKFVTKLLEGKVKVPVNSKQ